MLTRLLALLSIAVLPLLACQSHPPGPTSYSVSALVATPADLPPCDAAHVGTAAFAQSPPSLWACAASGKWTQINCATAQAGTVAYSSNPPLLLGCVSGQWAKIALPPGPPGDAGMNGANSLVLTSTEPPGVHCAEGGVRVDVGVDTNGDSVLQAAEVQQTAWVCNGANSAGQDGGVCATGDLQCFGLQPQLCSSTQEWKNVGAACGLACLSGGCVTCNPGANRCAPNANAIQTCTAAGEWSGDPDAGTAPACSGQTCSDGACIGVCEVGTAQCAGSGLVSVCDGTGQWGLPEACTPPGCSCP